ncbi:hypothetical protein TPHV1_170028 [Treponema phagedenis]|uniref:Uncharacterized protein n=1 Tax=Treponema phagedenis TaxID=162 RepID=A0A0B7GUS1_TREPH|nr:hypothetical protein TPHV1_170028 [Treponema phagedenis]
MSIFHVKNIADSKINTMLTKNYFKCNLSRLIWFINDTNRNAQIEDLKIIFIVLNIN